MGLCTVRVEEGVFFEWLSNGHYDNGGIQNKNKNKNKYKHVQLKLKSYIVKL